MRVDIIPVPNLREAIGGIEAVHVAGVPSVYVDEEYAETYESRYRFTLAHELGHIVLHTEYLAPLVRAILDQGPSPTSEELRAFNSGLSPAVRFSCDYQANRFAGCLLMPECHLRNHYKGLLPAIQERVGLARSHVKSTDEMRRQVAYYVANELHRAFDVSTDALERQLDFLSLCDPVQWSR